MTQDDIRRLAGLCGSCAHALIRPTAKGVTYLRCGLATTDSRLERYPRLPRVQCPAFTPQS